jgi:hypothetical protein
MAIELSNISPDFADLVTQLQTQLATKDAWKDRLTTSTGQTLVEFIAAIGAYSQYSIESSFQEEWPQSAKNANSIYAASNFLGVRVNRKGPTSITVLMSASVPTTVPVNGQFVGAGSYWFNRTPLVLTSTPSLVTLFQGEVKTSTFYGLGSNFQAFVTTEPNFVVSDTDILLTINSISVPVIPEGLWTKPGLAGVGDVTLPSGQMMLLFGNDVYGSKAGVNDLCVVKYIVTLGLNGDNIPTLGQTVSLETDPTITGKATTQASGGGDQNNYLVYKNITPALFGSFNSSITASQYKRLPLQYPGVLDAQTFAQHEVNPFALTWMNVIKVCLLTTTPFDINQWRAFETWYQDQTMYSTRLYREDPIASNIVVDAKIFCKNFANLSQIKVNAGTAVSALLQARQGILGLDIYRSDIIKAIMDSDSNIEYVILNSPTTDIILSSFVVDYPTAVITPSGGSLPIGSYDYAISAVSSLGGESAPAKWITVNTTVVNSVVTLTWPALTNAASYRIWGRVTPTSLGLITTVTGTTTTFADNGSITPTGSIPVEATTSIYYPHLSSQTLVVAYSNRDHLS